MSKYVLRRCPQSSNWPTFVTYIEASVVTVRLVCYKLDPNSRAFADHSLKRDRAAMAGIKQDHRTCVESAP